GIEVLRRPRRMGVGSAYRAGHAIGLARGYDVMVEMNADGSHDPAAIRNLLAAIESGADVAIGARYVPGGPVPNWPRRRPMLSVWGNRFADFALGLGVRDSTSGYRVYRASILRDIDLGSMHTNGYAFQIEMTHRALQARGHVAEVPIAFTNRVP